jgi:ADP-heptose:LPS heptosyltransferase
MRRYILIFHQAALGDFIVTWPLALTLSRMFPQSRLIYVTASSKGKLAEKVLGVESLDAENGWHHLHSSGADLSDGNKKAIENAHLIVSFGRADEIWRRNVLAIAGDAILINLDTKLDSAGADQHVTAHLLHQLHPNSAIHTAMAQILRAIQLRGIAYRRAPSGRIVIHPGAGSLEKCWPVENFVALIELLQENGKSLRVLFGEAELEKWPIRAIQNVESAAEVVRPANYLDLLDEIAQASVFVGNDSGSGHLAGIIGVPTISLFGSPPDRWHPIGPRITVVRGEPIEAITVQQVFQWINRICPKFGTSAGAESIGLKPAGQ